MKTCETCGHPIEAHANGNNCQATIYFYPNAHQLDYTYPCPCKKAVALQPVATASTAPKRRGRPPKQAPSTIPPKPRGRPHKVATG